MTNAIAKRHGLADSLAELFDAIDVTPIERLLAEHAEHVRTIERVFDTFADPAFAAVLPYFLSVAESNTYTGARLFNPEHRDGVSRELDAAYWQRALDATDVLASMPSEEREKWADALDLSGHRRQRGTQQAVPPFTPENVRATITDHLANRPLYFAQRVDGIFRALSTDHRTNLASGFRAQGKGANMIIAGMYDSWGSNAREAVLVDLRTVTARFTGRDIGEGTNALYRNTGAVLTYARSLPGEWVSLDGGAIEIKLHKSGTCHVRVHDEIAWRLNAVLASIHPGAIPESNRTRPAYTGKRAKAKAPPIELMLRPLPLPVLRMLAEYSRSSCVKANRPMSVSEYTWTCSFHAWKEADKHVRAETLAVLESIGGAIDESSVTFDFDAREVIAEIMASGVVPDQRAHQYYPTTAWLAERVIELAQIEAGDRVLEPSAGQGAIAEHVPDWRRHLTCIERSELHSKILQAKLYEAKVECCDFLTFRGETFDAIVMNPPYDRGQWRAHVEHAASMLAVNGRLVAVLPASAIGAELHLSGCSITWHEQIDNAFAGTSASVRILVAVKVGAA